MADLPQTGSGLFQSPFEDYVLPDSLLGRSMEVLIQVSIPFRGLRPSGLDQILSLLVEEIKFQSPFEDYALPDNIISFYKKRAMSVSIPSRGLRPSELVVRSSGDMMFKTSFNPLSRIRPFLTR